MNMREPWADEELALQSTARKRSHWVARGALAAGLLCFAAVLAWATYSLMADSKPIRKQVVQISLLRPPPPPPPPPPPEQKMPEPQVKEEVKIPQPQEPEQDEPTPPQSEQLGLDADGSGNGDNFGLAAKKGGTDITKIGGPAGGGSERAWFAGLVQSHLQTELSRHQNLRQADYRVGMRIWFSGDGRIQRFELTDSTGNAELDRSIKLAMEHMPPLRQPPPSDLAQPVKLRVTSRGAG